MSKVKAVVENPGDVEAVILKLENAERSAQMSQRLVTRAAIRQGIDSLRQQQAEIERLERENSDKSQLLASFRQQLAKGE